MVCKICEVKEARKNRRQCNTCRDKAYAARHPEMNEYHRIKVDAKRRGKIFTLTFEYFKAWCEQTGYILLKGKGADDMSIDRVIPNLGYADGNIQMLTLSANAKKRHTDDKKYGWDVPVRNYSDVPF